MHKQFGEKKDAFYTDRKGAYLIPIRDGLVGVIKTQKGHFLIGGGMEEGESCEECIERECLEEAGLKVRIIKKLCSAESYIVHSEIGYFHPIQYYYLGEIIDTVQPSVENDHYFQWIPYKDILGKMFSEMQNWAVEQALKGITD